MPRVVRNLNGCEPLRIDELTKSLPVLNDWAKAQSHEFLGAATANRVVTLFAILFLGISFSRLSSAEEKSQKREAELISKENSVDSSRPPGEWRSATVGQELIVHDRLRTGEDSRAAVQFGDSSVLRIDELTEEEILPPQVASDKPTLNLKQGSAYFFSREKSREIRVQTPAANGAIRGTEFVVTVAENGSTNFTILDGEVEVSNSQGSVVVQSGERAEIQPTGQPAKAPVTNPMDSVQWCFYYPSVLDINDLALSPPEQDRLRESLSAYGQGDGLRALAEYPHGRVPASPGEKVYRAGLFLVAGQIRKAEELLHDVDEMAPGRQSLSTLIAAVTLKEKTISPPPQTATDWVAESYYRQSKSDLAGALQAAERAASLDANFGFAWTRVAESQFNLGRAPEAKEALEKGLKLAPRNPAAHALRGFLLSAENNLKDAKESFETAIALDSALGDGWLGRGLCLIKQGHVETGRRDLLIAVALEPNRAMFRRYLSENFNIVSAATSPPKKVASRPEKTSRSEKTASPKPRYSQTAPRPTSHREITTAPTPYPGQPLPGLQIGIGIGSGRRYPYPPRHTPPPTHQEGSGQSHHGDQSRPTPTPSYGVAAQGGSQTHHTGTNKPIKRRTPTP
jgi:tetratricopeptide (TPR) repeat protein